MVRRFLIQGHRGARGLRPENTLPSFEAALDAGVGSLELDVHLTKDGVPVVFHDSCIHEAICRLRPNAPASVPRPETRPPICELSHDNIRWYIADQNPDPVRFPHQKSEMAPLAASFWRDASHSYGIPSLAELYRFVADYSGEPGRAVQKDDGQRATAGSVFIDVEIKWEPFRAADLGHEPSALERSVLNVIESAGMAGRTWIRSFDHRCVRRLRNSKSLLTGVVLIADTAPVDPSAMVGTADAKVYAPDYLFLDNELVQQCHDAGFEVLPWTVNDVTSWERLVAWGVDGITTDYPDRLAAWYVGSTQGDKEIGY